MAKQTVLHSKTLYDGIGKSLNKTIVIEGNKIVDVTTRKLKSSIDGYVTPAFIDAHSHIGMAREGEPIQEKEGNEITNQFLPLLNPLNSVYYDDRAFKDAVDFGILYSCIVPGSGNLIGGKAMIIKNFANNCSDALFKDYGYKMALGYNPRSTTEWKGQRPVTRMGLYAMLEEKFDTLLIKQQKIILGHEKKLRDLENSKKEKKLTKKAFNTELAHQEQHLSLAFSPEEKALLEILSGQKTIKVHVHKEDDALYLIQLAERYKLKVTAEHCCDIFHQEIFDELAKNNIPIVYGPLGAIGYKTELKHAYYQNASLIMNSKADWGLMTDHPVIHSSNLRDSLKYFLINGMSKETAISIITHKNARILGIDDRLGTIKKGKLASLIVWDKDPFDLAAFPKMVIAEGQVIRKR